MNCVRSMTTLKGNTSVPSGVFDRTFPKYAVASACRPWSKTAGTKMCIQIISIILRL